MIKWNGLYSLRAHCENCEQETTELDSKVIYPWYSGTYVANMVVVEVAAAECSGGCGDVFADARIDTHD